MAVSAQKTTLLSTTATAAVTPIELYTDGSSRGNPGPGGYGVILKYKGHAKQISQGFRLTTNNRMELLAVITGLESLTRTDLPVVVYSDSKYVIDGIEKGWALGWQKKGFAGKKNPDLWKRLLELVKKHKVRWVWVKGHAGHAENEACDVMAVKAAMGKNLLTDHEYERENKS